MSFVFLVDTNRQPLSLKLDPGSRISGIAIVADASGQVLFAAELAHRSQQIKKALDDRRAVRRRRRAGHTRYRKPRFQNRSRPPGWLVPSLQSRVCNIATWVKRLRKLCPVTAISMELVRFDLHLMQNPEISGIQYQQGTLAGYERREYLPAKKPDLLKQIKPLAITANGHGSRQMCLMKELLPSPPTKAR